MRAEALDGEDLPVTVVGDPGTTFDVDVVVDAASARLAAAETASRSGRDPADSAVLTGSVGTEK
ncbi:hypothetical protein OB920_20070 [Halobacteria archaeon HArc-gm2]|nr:hypothetical protein [Halobacteria archaeon HArc-gm2]